MIYKVLHSAIEVRPVDIKQKTTLELPESTDVNTWRQQPPSIKCWNWHPFPPNFPIE